MKKRFECVLFTCLFVLFLTAGVVQAFILDTGVTDTTFANQTDFIERDMYGRFTLNESYRVTSLQGFFIRDAEFFPEPTDAPFRVSLYRGDAFNPPEHPSSGLRHPDLDQLISSQSFILPGGIDLSGYYGISSANLDLGPGAYWIGLERDNVGRPWGVGAGIAQFPPSDYRYLYDTGGFHAGDNAKQFAYRVDGYATPEPLSIVLLGSGLLGMVFFRRKND